MLVVEGIPFSNFQEYLSIMRNLKHERNVQVLDHCVYIQRYEKNHRKVAKVEKAPEVIKAEETNLTLKEFKKEKLCKYEKRVKNRQALYEKKKK
ncbi:MAG: hypothetical protein Q8936_01785 [Bacillota bacterium]|nr:hypothetical protein [Bacillota bacterium]